MFSREGDDILVEVPITFDEAVLGGKVEVPTITGNVLATVPPGSNTGKTLRLKGRGIKGKGGKHGDQLVKLFVVMPEHIDDDLKAFAEEWRDKHNYDPRRKLKEQDLMLTEHDIVAKVQHVTVTRLASGCGRVGSGQPMRPQGPSPKPTWRGPR